METITVMGQFELLIFLVPVDGKDDLDNVERKLHNLLCLINVKQMQTLSSLQSSLSS